MPGERRPKRLKIQQLADKVLDIIYILFIHIGIIFIDYLEQGKTINKENYCTLLDRLDAEIEVTPHCEAIDFSDFSVIS